MFVGDREFGSDGFSLRFLEHVDVLGDSLCFRVVTHHFRMEVYNFARMETAAIVIEVIDEFLGSDVRVKRTDVLQVLVPHFLDGVADEFGDGAFGGVVGFVVSD